MSIIKSRDSEVAPNERTSGSFFENLFTVSRYLGPFFGGVGGLMPIILGVLGSWLLGIGVGDLGRVIDNIVGTGPGVAPTSATPNRIGVLLRSAMNEKLKLESVAMSQRDEVIVKQAGIFSLIGKFGSISKIVSVIVNFIKKMMYAIPGVFLLSSIDDFVRKMTAPIRTRTTGKPEGILGKPEEYEDSDNSKKPGPPIAEPTKPGMNDIEILLNTLEKGYGI